MTDEGIPTVLHRRLRAAAQIMKDVAPVLGEANVQYVLIELGLEPYCEYTEDGRFILRDLTPLQTVALAAALHAFRESSQQYGLI